MLEKKKPDSSAKVASAAYAIGDTKYDRSSRLAMAMTCRTLLALSRQLEKDLFERQRVAAQRQQLPAGGERAGDAAANVDAKFALDPRGDRIGAGPRRPNRGHTRHAGKRHLDVGCRGAA